DKCPDTPEGIAVDANGCPFDADGDGVADYLDKCPNTPAAARGKVDAKGCPLDTDEDGVPDYLDKCPNSAKGFVVDENGCTEDADGDGVPDDVDRCPNTPAEARGMVDANGCPLDSDGDGVADFEDKCPAIIGTKSNFGCPEIKAAAKKIFQKAMKGIQFETGKDVILPSSYGILDQIAKIMKDNPEYKIDINGHTDNVGKPESNLKLSDKRANSVRNYLMKKGVEGERMTATGYGDTKPIADNATKAGKAQNRRVEFVVTVVEE
ncbi:MAG: OmpA family protein, partial [Paludibacteraceae bacterium]|nr:OmpA family protein [Paludibacteraceae bacterium]